MVSVREMQEQDIDQVVNYWMNADPAFLHSMGVDVDKMPTGEQFKEILTRQLNLPINQRSSYCILWQLEGNTVGHCNTNPTVFGEEAFMHLHLWENNTRKKGLGSTFLKMTLPYFFQNLQLKTLYSEPYALNTAPNKTLEKVGFHFIKQYTTTPGSINFEQPVKRWELNYKNYLHLMQI